MIIKCDFLPAWTPTRFHWMQYQSSWVDYLANTDQDKCEAAKSTPGWSLIIKKQRINPAKTCLDCSERSTLFPYTTLFRSSLTGVCVCIQTKEAHHKHESCWQHQSLELLYCLRTWLARQLWENKNIKLEETVPGVHWRNHSRINTFFFQSSDLRKAVEGQQHVSDWLLDQQPEILHQKL